VTSDFGALAALEHEQAVADPVAGERCLEFVRPLGEMSPAFENSNGITTRAPRIRTTSAAWSADSVR